MNSDFDRWLTEMIGPAKETTRTEGREVPDNTRDAVFVSDDARTFADGERKAKRWFDEIFGPDPYDLHTARFIQVPQNGMQESRFEAIAKGTHTTPNRCNYGPFGVPVTIPHPDEWQDEE